MAVTRITKGLDLPIAGRPEQSIGGNLQVRHVALVGDDYTGMKPSMAVAEGDRVRTGQVVFLDKKTPGVQYTAPGAGKVVAINRGAKRKFESLVIELEGDDEETFDAYPDENLTQLDRSAIRDPLVASGLWTALRTRPFSKVPSPESIPHSLFVTAIDTNPLAADPAVVLAGRVAEFIAGLQALCILAEGHVHVCHRAGTDIPGSGKTPATFHPFAGVHPAGLVGTHIHTIDPACENKTVWHIGYQDVIAVGHLFLTGHLLTERIVSLAGPLVRQPRLIRTRFGASLSEMTDGQFDVGVGGETRILSGSVLSGRRSVAPVDFLGRYHLQVSVLAEGRERELIGWLKPGHNKFSIRRIFSSAWTADTKGTAANTRGQSSRCFDMNTSTGGSSRAIVPIGMYEEVMPLDLIATPLLKALVTGDTQCAQQLGLLELDEEDLALCTFVCPGKIDYGPLLRESLTTIEREG